MEEADAKRLAMASRVGELEQQLASVRRGEEDSYDQVGRWVGELVVQGLWDGCLCIALACVWWRLIHCLNLAAHAC